MFVLRFLARRLMQGALIVFLVSALIFTLLRVVPGDQLHLAPLPGRARWFDPETETAAPVTTAA